MWSFCCSIVRTREDLGFARTIRHKHFPIHNFRQTYTYNYRLIMLIDGGEKNRSLFVPPNCGWTIFITFQYQTTKGFFHDFWCIVLNTIDVLTLQISRCNANPAITIFRMFYKSLREITTKISNNNKH